MKTEKNKNNRETRKEILKGIRNSCLVFSPVFLGFTIFTLSKGDPLLFSLGSFIAGFTGIIVVVKKEIPVGLTSIRGTRAVVEGILTMILFWGLAVFFLIEGLKLNL